MAALALFAGLRRVEISRLDCEDVTAGKVTVVRGKGEKRRDVFIPAPAQDALAAWLAVRGGRSGPLFWRGLRGGGVVEGRLSVWGVWRGLADACTRAGIENVTPHDFRRTFASTLLDVGVDLAEVSKRMGHADPRTTAKYDRRGDAAGKAAADRLAERWGKK
jgi:integrase